VDLNGEVVASIEDLDEKWKAIPGEPLSKDFLAVICPEIVKGFAGIITRRYGGLLIGTIAHFPRLPVRLVVREFPLIDCLQRTSSPHAGHVNWRESNRFHFEKMRGRGRFDKETVILVNI
jgi:hypothetical protein